MADCLFCRIVAGQIPAQKLHEDTQCVAFADINPQAPTHVLLVPKRHIATLNDATSEDRELMGHLVFTAAGIARQQGLTDSGYRVVINCNKDAGQTVFHIHVHILGGRQLGWPPG
jgi:histidine triad (HIT) family protein